MSKNMDHMFGKTILVVAHPDDEALWFSSVLGTVDAIVICYLNPHGKPGLGRARQASLQEHVHKNIVCLGVDESGVFEKGLFDDKTVTEYGIEVEAGKKRRENYRENFDVLVKTLRTTLLGYTDVITHNPWGEYGHAEHIQVYAAIKHLSERMNYNVWFTNYCSNRTIKLMSKLMSTRRLEYVPLKTNAMLAKEMMAIYQKNGCSTWYEDWQWFDEESLIRDNHDTPGERASGQRLPLNCIFMPVSIQPGKQGWRSRIFGSLSPRSR